LFVLLAALAGPVGLVHAARVDSVRVASGPETTRVVIDLSGPVQHRLFALSNPDRIVIDLPATSIASQIKLPGAKGFVSNVRTGPRPNGELRVVLDVSQGVKPKSFLLPPGDQFGDRLVIDLAPGSSSAVVRRAPAAPSARGRDLVIAIDAGHGGRDPGASGPRGVREKDVVLAVARRLASEIDREAGMRALLVRDGDYYVSHRDRMQRARDQEADLFISIHADAYHDASARGATVYALSTKRASDEVARRLAERENASDLLGGVSLADKDDVLARVLLDLSQSAAISASMAAGDRVIGRMGDITRLRKTQVQQGPFLVLTSPDIPSILIETAYISNPNEEQALNSSQYQTDLARAVHAGIVDYFRDNPPPGSYVAMNPPPRPAAPTQHVISSGETLSQIAERYRINLNLLRRTNELRNDRIRIGQVLTIPPG
jgi:N-acetylmuramoyl-L-alanine amidase